MKKILSLALAAAMVVAALPVAYAAENETDYSNGTEITYIGSQEEAAGGAGDVWTVTVPAKMQPGQTGTVKAEGMWNSDTFLAVYAPNTVTLTYGAQTMDVAITGGSFSLIGNSAEAVSKEVEIAVEDASRLFGTWEGVLEYDVALIQKGDVDRDGLITDADATLIREYVANSIEDEQQKANIEAYGDLNNDGPVDTGDAGVISRVIAGTAGVLAQFYTTTE